MSLPFQPLTAICPYCEQPISSISGRMDCSHCARLVFNVACPKCARPTLNLTLLPRYGRVTCFACGFELEQVPQDNSELPLVICQALPESATQSLPPRTRPAILLRPPKSPPEPDLAETRTSIEHWLSGLERLLMERAMMPTPDLRAIAMRYIDRVQEAMQLDAEMEADGVTAMRLRESKPLALIARLCFQPLWTLDVVLLPTTLQRWALAADDALRQWQFLRRCWLAEQYGLTLMPTVPGITTTNALWHIIDGNGPVVLFVMEPGFLLHGEVLQKARVRS